MAKPFQELQNKMSAASRKRSDEIAAKLRKEIRLTRAKISWSNLLRRIERNPVRHLGTASPKQLNPYFFGYSLALTHHSASSIAGSPSLHDFSQWFSQNAYDGPQGWEGFCELLTDSSEDALALFFQFWKLSKNSRVGDIRRENRADDDAPTLIELLKSDTLRNRPALYFGNADWVPGVWAMWSGYIWAERDLKITESPELIVFSGFQEWLQRRYPFLGKNRWGKLFNFLAMDVEMKAYANFFDHLDLFLEGAPYDARTRRNQEWLETVLEEAVRESEKTPKL